VLNENVPNFLHYAKLLFAENFITTSLAHNKLKCGSFNRIISLYNSLHKNYLNLCSVCQMLIAASMTD